jgi:hypothetical protein
MEGNFESIYNFHQIQNSIAWTYEELDVDPNNDQTPCIDAPEPNVDGQQLLRKPHLTFIKSSAKKVHSGSFPSM